MKIEKIKYSISWVLTNKCNLNCKFCFKKLCEDRSLEENKKIFDNFSQINIQKLTISGGEALLYDGFYQLIEYIKEKKPKLKLNLITNATLVNLQNVEFLCKNFDKITLSIDSLNKNVLERMGRGSAQIDNAKNALDLLNDNIKLKVTSLVTKQNYRDFKDIHKFLLGYNIEEWKILNFYPLRKGEHYKNLFMMNKKEKEEFHKIMSDLSINSPLKIKTDSVDDIAVSNLNVYPNGSVENCMDEDIGNLSKQSIFEILKQKRRFDRMYDLALIVEKARPIPRRDVDQIWMYNRAMVVQATKCFGHLQNKHCVFLGDGDGASSYYALLQHNKLVHPIASITVLDFDDNILNYHKSIISSHNIDIDCKYINYNVRDIVPQNLKNQFDFFYINPPYASHNNGASIKAWLHRCIDLIKDHAQGCIIIPTDKDYPWSIANTKEIEKFLSDYGFSVKEIFFNLHDYDLDCTSFIKSSTYIVERVEKVPSEFENKKITTEILSDLY